MADAERRVVVVDDDPDILWLVGDALEGEGFTVSAVDHPDLVEDTQERGSPALFVIDLLLPGIGGIELAWRLRQTGFEGTPIIAITASKQSLQEAEASGLFLCTLEKPLELEALLECVRQTLE